MLGIEKQHLTCIIQHMLISSVRNVALACLAAVLLGGPAVAWGQDMYAAPTKEEQVPWFSILYIAVGLIAIAVVAFKSARRSPVN